MKPFAWTGVGLASAVLAHALAVTAVSHGHYVAPPPNRQGWFYAELILALVLWLPAHRYARWVWKHFREAPVSRLGLSLVLGLAVHLWWVGQFEDTLWLHKPPAQAILRPAAWVAEWLTVSAAFAGLLALTVTLLPPFPPSGSGEGEHTPLRVAATPLVAFALFLAVANAFAVWYVGCERTLYYWDYMVYWTRCADLAELMRTASPVDVWGHVRHGTRADDYGPLPAAPPAAVVAVFGDTRLVYILAVVNLYLAALAVAAWLFVRRFAPSAGAAGVVVPLVLVLLSPVAWGPLLRGYLDVGGAALAVLAVLVYLSRPAGGLSWQRVLLLAGVLAGMAIFRRWYSFFVVAFFLVAGLDSTLAMLRHGWRRLVPVGLVGVWAVVLVLAFAFDWVKRAATTDYATDYVAYKSLDSLGERVALLIDNCGPGAVALAGVSLLVLLAYRDTRRAALVVGGMVPVMVLHFQSVQDFGTHHCYLLLPALVLLPALALVRVSSGWWRWAAVALVVAAGVAAMAVMFVPEAKPFHSRLRPAVSRLHVPPLTRDDLPEFVRLLRATEAEAARTDGGRVAVVASSLVISPTMFTTADRSLREPVFRRERIVVTPEVDRVGSGFPEGYFQAEVLVVPRPPQTHLRAEEQQIVIVTTGSLLNGTDIGRAFDRLPGEFHLADGVTVCLYRRARPVALNDYEAYRDKLRQAHPDVPHVYTPEVPVGELLRGP